MADLNITGKRNLRDFVDPTDTRMFILIYGGNIGEIISVNGLPIFDGLAMAVAAREDAHQPDHEDFPVHKDDIQIYELVPTDL